MKFSSICRVLLGFLLLINFLNASVIKKSFKVASIQFNPKIYNLDDNVKNLAKVVEEAAKNGAKLIVTPEMSTTGYGYKSRKDIKPYVTPIPGKVSNIFLKIAKKYDTYIVVGMPELDKKTGLYYNAAFLVGPEGYIGKYRKTHQWETEEHFAAWGDLGVPVFDTKIGKIAINICMDSAYFESARLAGINGADILAFPTNSSAQAISALQARAQQNGMYVVSANRSNTELGFHMIGASAIWSPSGEKLAEAKFSKSKDEDINEPTITYAMIDPSKYKNPAKDRMKERRVELYKDLMLYIAPWDYTKNTKSKEINALALQYEPVLGDKEKNIKKIQSLISKKTKSKKINLIVLPELSTTGIVKTLAKAKKLAEPQDGKSVKQMLTLAKKQKAYLVFGFIEKDDNKLYNTALLASPEGKIVGKYRKTHLSKADKAWASMGDEIKVFNTQIGKIGLMIGYEVNFPEVAGVLSIKRADIITIPSSWNGEYGSKIEINDKISANKYPTNSMTLWDSVAMSAQAYTIVSNFVGTKDNFLGSSSLYTLDPLYKLDQPVATSRKKEEAFEVSFKTLQSKWWFNQQKLIDSRRTYFYTPLVY